MSSCRPSRFELGLIAAVRRGRNEGWGRVSRSLPDFTTYLSKLTLTRIDKDGKNWERKRASDQLHLHAKKALDLLGIVPANRLASPKKVGCMAYCC